MITKKQLIDSLTHECNVVKHLAQKLLPQMLEYRPQKGMRSTLELLRYLSICGVSPVKAAVNENWEIMKAYREQAEKLSFEDFPAAMDRQAADLRETINALTDQDLTTKRVKFPWGQEDIMGMAIVNTALKFLTAYRMQLYHYAKEAGVEGLNTANCWAGVDAPRP